MKFSLESPAPPLSQSDMVYLEKMLLGGEPTWEQIDALICSDDYLHALHDGYASLFFLREPETVLLVGNDPALDGRYLQHHFLALRHPLNASTLAALRLAPVDARSLAFVVLPYYRLRYHYSDDEETWVFLKADSRIRRGVIVHPSTKMNGQWQLTYFDRDGLDHDETKPKDIEVLLDLFSRRYILPAPNVVDELALHSWKERYP